MADIERTRDVYHGSLRQPEAAQNVLGSLKNALRGQNHVLVHAFTVCVSLSGSG